MTGDHNDSENTRSFAAISRGTVISRYRVVDYIDSGGMGDVYLAEDTDLHRQVVLKFIAARLADDESLKARLIREAQAAAALNHPNIITVHEVGEHLGRAYIAMEHVSGKSLKRIIQSGPMEIETAIELAIQMGEALSHAHKAGITHRDIKPQNILLDDDGRTKILDFGLARFRGTADLTKQGSTVGTAAYMSPEQVDGIDVDHRSDIFSFGAVLYEMLAGKPAFEGDYEAAVLYSLVYKDPPPIESTRKDVPKRLSKIITRALAKSRDQRYQNIADMTADLRELRNRTPVSIKGAAREHGFASIAVLQFADMSPDHDQEYFCDGIAEELINVLTKIPGLRVASRTSAFQFRGRDLDVRHIGGQLGVETVVEGSVRKAGNRLRITAQLVNVSDGYHLWSERYDRDLEDVFAIQDDIARAISEKLQVKLMGAPEIKSLKRPTENLEAYNLYLRGRYFWNKRYEGGLQKSMQYFQQAIEKDPGYALAYAGLADAYNICGFYNFMAPHDACPKAKAAAIRALEIDSDLAEAHTSLGWVLTFYEWDWEGSEAEFARSLELNPNYSLTHHYYALHLLARKRFDEGISEIKRARELDPLSLIINTCVGAAYYFARQHDSAIEHYLRTLDLDPNFALAHAFFAGPYVEKAMFPEAIVECRKAGALAGGSKYAAAFLAYAYAVSGQEVEARKLLAQLLEQAQSSYVSSNHISLVYIGLGEIEEAFVWLEKAYEERDNWMIWLDVYPVFDRLRDDPRFEVMRRKVNLA